MNTMEKFRRLGNETEKAIRKAVKIGLVAMLIGTIAGIAYGDYVFITENYEILFQSEIRYRNLFWELLLRVDLYSFLSFVYVGFSFYLWGKFSKYSKKLLCALGFKQYYDDESLMEIEIELIQYLWRLLRSKKFLIPMTCFLTILWIIITFVLIYREPIYMLDLTLFSATIFFLVFGYLGARKTIELYKKYEINRSRILMQRKVALIHVSMAFFGALTFLLIFYFWPFVSEFLLQLIVDPHSLMKHHAVPILLPIILSISRAEIVVLPLAFGLWILGMFLLYGVPTLILYGWKRIYVALTSFMVNFVVDLTAFHAFEPTLSQKIGIPLLSSVIIFIITYQVVKVLEKYVKKVFRDTY